MTEIKLIDKFHYLENMIIELGKRIDNMEQLLKINTNSKVILSGRYVVADPSNEYQDKKGNWYGEPIWTEYNDLEFAKQHADKVSGCILDSEKENMGIYTSPNYLSQHDGEILTCNHSSALDDCVMECFIFHKMQRRSRI